MAHIFDSISFNKLSSAEKLCANNGTTLNYISLAVIDGESEVKE